MTDVSSRLHFALQMAAAASELILKHYQVDGLLVESKSDDSPVTVADREAEHADPKNAGGIISPGWNSGGRIRIDSRQERLSLDP